MTAKRSRNVLTTHEVAERLKLKPDTVRKYANRGILPAYHLSPSPYSALRFWEWGVDEYQDRARPAK